MVEAVREVGAELVAELRGLRKEVAKVRATVNRHGNRMRDVVESLANDLAATYWPKVFGEVESSEGERSEEEREVAEELGELVEEARETLLDAGSYDYIAGGENSFLS